MCLKGPVDKGEAETHPPQSVRLMHFHAGKYRGWPENQTQSQNPMVWFPLSNLNLLKVFMPQSVGDK